MVIKGAENYDSICHAGADQEFIERVFTVNINNLEQCKEQLLQKYAIEYQMNLQNSQTEAERSIATALNNRNLAIIEKVYNKYIIKQIEKSNSGNFKLSPQDAIAQAEANYFMVENDLKITEINYSILKVVDSLGIDVIFGQERDLLQYAELIKYYNNEKEDGRTLIEHQIEQLKSDLEMAQINLDNIYDATKSIGK